MGGTTQGSTLGVSRSWSNTGGDGKIRKGKGDVGREDSSGQHWGGGKEPGLEAEWGGLGQSKEEGERVSGCKVGGACGQSS